MKQNVLQPPKPPLRLSVVRVLFETTPAGFFALGSPVGPSGTRVGPREAVWGSGFALVPPHGLPRAHTGPLVVQQGSLEQKTRREGFENMTLPPGAFGYLAGGL